jgi:hypothetical protein
LEHGGKGMSKEDVRVTRKKWKETQEMEGIRMEEER